MNKKYRFFYHYNKKNNKITVHFRNTCYIAKNIVCNTSVNSKWNKVQPRLVMQGWCNNISVQDDSITIE